ncbi:DUF1707 SHOCT-like domain-containing protein [Corynebacterium oculi]|uniref:DUF1707 domain-containing protein n=1 Tax=Corynebacterium oculi TaxID=1544416 RepID=A0A0Q1AAJ6_9CORY|nr:DUF1707 domain-containing protein [Corynebacterium oculi]KQB83777.1 hypothetical protein Cocul_01850 [Corynebacterium oculi]
MPEKREGDAEIRVGDRERSAALESLSEYFVRGFIDVAEFEERTGRAAVARTREDVAAVLGDLPELEPEEPAPTAERETQRELDSLLRRGHTVQAIDAVFGAVATVAFVGGVIVADWDWAWGGVTIGALVIPYVFRTFYSYNDEDEEIFNKLQKEEKKKRTERLRVATRRRRELGA